MAPVAITLTPYGGLAGLLLVEGKSFPDDRGFFMEAFRADDWAKAGLPPLVQDNLSRSRKGVVRGLHYQKPPQAIGKLVRCARGRVFDVAVDIRRGSPTFGRWVGAELSADNARQMLVPKGFAHAYCTLTEECEVLYKCTDYYAPPCEGALRWSDPSIGIDWIVPADAISTNARDDSAALLADFDSPFVYGQIG